MKFDFTEEQLNIIYSEESKIYVDAKAGTGKTSTLSEFAKIRRYESFLYLVYNSSMRSSAKEKFSPNVEVHTIHSLAYQYIGYKYKERIIPNLKVENVFNSLSFFNGKEISDNYFYNMAFSILEIINNYCNSSEEKIYHVNEEVLKLSNEYWNLMIDINGKIPISNDVYLKLYYLSNPVLDYDYIIVDEAQDLNKVSKEIISIQKSKKVFIGDRDQKIYGFRGAVNIFDDKEEGFSDYTLSKSFRFGKEIAFVANILLKKFKEDNKILEVVGCDIDSVINQFNYDEQYTIISRTNAVLFQNAIRLVEEGKKIHIIGGFDNIKKQALNVFYLYKNKRNLIDNDFLRKLKNFNHLVILAEETNNPEYKLMISFIERYGDFLEKYINLIDSNLTSEKLSDVTLVTAHKSKGLEFYNVVLDNDFAELFSGLNKNKVEEEEINLIYVAITRAIEALVLNNDLNILVGIK